MGPSQKERIVSQAIFRGEKMLVPGRVHPQILVDSSHVSYRFVFCNAAETRNTPLHWKLEAAKLNSPSANRFASNASVGGLIPIYHGRIRQNHQKNTQIQEVIAVSTGRVTHHRVGKGRVSSHLPKNNPKTPQVSVYLKNLQPWSWTS